MWVFVIIWATQDYKAQIKKFEKKHPYKASKEVDRLLELDEFEKNIS